MKFEWNECGYARVKMPGLAIEIVLGIIKSLT